MERHKYLEDLGLPREQITVNLCGDDDERAERWAKQKEEYGFSDRETWDLQAAFIEWLYEHLMMFVDIGGEVVDTTFWKFEIDGVLKTQQECIDMMLDLCRQYIAVESGDVWSMEDDEMRSELCRKICTIWREVSDAMWW